MFAIGPQRVLAQVQQWLGYLSGVGFVNPEQVRVLAAPVEARQGNITLQVTQLIAGPKQTVLVAKLDGPAEEISEGLDWNQLVTIILPDGYRLIPMSASQTINAGHLQAEIKYVRIPAGVNRVTLEMPKLPIVTKGTQEFWSVVLPLIGVIQGTADANGGASTDNLAVAPYTPKIVQVANQGVTVHLLQAAHSVQETGLLLQFDWSDPTWDFRGAIVELRDNLGRVYKRLEPPPFSGPYSIGKSHEQITAQQMMRFAPVEADIRQLTLTLKAIYFEAYPAVQFEFDPGDHASLGQSWSFVNDPTKRLIIAGFQVQVVQVDLTTPPAGAKLNVPERPKGTLIPEPTSVPEPTCRLEFILEITPQALSQIIFPGASLVGIYPSSFGYSSIDNGHHYTYYMDFAEIPTAPLTIAVDDVTFNLQGGWEFNWNLPSAATRRSP